MIRPPQCTRPRIFRSSSLERGTEMFLPRLCSFCGGPSITSHVFRKEKDQSLLVYVHTNFLFLELAFVWVGAHATVAFLFRSDVYKRVNRPINSSPPLKQQTPWPNSDQIREIARPPLTTCSHIARSRRAVSKGLCYASNSWSKRQERACWCVDIHVHFVYEPNCLLRIDQSPSTMPFAEG